jgi:hypothetical protein
MTQEIESDSFLVIGPKNREKEDFPLYSLELSGIIPVSATTQY